MKKLTLSFFLVLLLSSTTTIAQTTNLTKWGWAKNIAGTTVDIVTDTLGRTYVLGNFSSSITIENQTLSGNGSYIAVYDSTSKFLSLNKLISGASNALQLVRDQAGNMIVCGKFNGTITAGNFKIVQESSVNVHTDGFVLKVNSSFVPQFINQYKNDSTGDESVNSVCTDNIGNVYLVSTIFNSSLSIYYRNLIKLTPSGSQEWLKNVTGISSLWNDFSSISSDIYGNVYLAITYFVSQSNQKYIQFQKIDTDGNLIFIRNILISVFTKFKVKTDHTGNTFITGTFYGSQTFDALTLNSAGNYDIFLVKYNASGQVVWGKSAGGVDNDYGSNLVLDRLGNCYLTGKIQQKVKFSTIEVNNPNSGVSDAFVAKYNSLGDVEWVMNAGNAGIDDAVAVSLDGLNNCYLTGSYSANINFGSIRLTTGTSSSYLSKINVSEPSGRSIFTLPLTKLTYISGTEIEVPFRTYGEVKNGTVYTVELSDPTGGFFYPVAIGTGIKSPIKAVIPPLSVISNTYRVRVVALSENLIGNDNGSDIALNHSGLQITPNWSFSKNIEGKTTSMTCSSKNQLFTSGNYDAPFQLEKYQMTGAGSYIASYDTNGVLQWAKQIISGTSYIKFITTDTEGNLYVTGKFGNSISLSGNNLTSLGKNDVFLAKFNNQGILQFFKQFGTIEDNDVSKGLSLDIDFNIVFAYYDIDNTFNNSSVTFKLSKLDAYGSLLWKKDLENPTKSVYFTDIVSVSNDQFGNSYLIRSKFINSGSFFSIVGFLVDNFEFLKIDPSGNTVWKKSFSGYFSPTFSLRIDSDGNCIIHGAFMTNITFGTATLTSNGNLDVFIAKYDPTGQVLWAKNVGGLDNEIASDITMDSKNNIYFTGKYQHTVNFGGIGISNFNSGISDIFVAKYDKDGNAIWVKQAGEIGVDAPTSIAVDANGNCYVTGTFTKSIAFDNDKYTTTSTSGFLAKIGSSYTTLIGKASLISQSQICSGNVFKVQYPIKGVFKEGNEFIAQLSDKNGSFANPIKIGSIETALNNTIYTIVPEVPDGNGYRIRVVSTQPELIGEDNGYNISINMANCKAAPVVEVAIPIVGVEYFYNKEENKRSYIALPRAETSATIQQFSTEGLAPGFHNLFVRFKDSLNRWSLYEGRVIYIQPVVKTTSPSKIVAYEYFFNSEPGVGKGSVVTIAKYTENYASTVKVPTTGLASGFHNLFIRFKDSLNNWGMYEPRVVYVQPEIKLTKPARIVQAEYFVDTDPGEGLGQKLASFSATDALQIVRDLKTTNLTVGFHNLFVRVKDSINNWSQVVAKTFYVDDAVTLNSPLKNIIAAEYFINSDPGFGKATPIQGIVASNSITRSISVTPTNLSSRDNHLYVRVKHQDGVWSLYEWQKFIVCTDVMPKPQITSSPSVCAGSTITLSGKAVIGAVSYLWKGPNNFTATGLTASISNSDINHTGKYILYAVRNGGTSCDTSNAEVAVTVLPVQRKSNPQTICKGGFYEINGKKYVSAGTYEDILKSKNGCDSIITTNLKVNEPSTFKEVKHICQGETYKGYSTTGVYSKKLTNSVGCDSTYTLDLIVHAPVKKVENKTICIGETYKGKTKTGSYTFSFTTSYGCDSTEQLNLTVRSKDTTAFSKSICKGQTYEGKSTSGVYYLNKKSVYGCDSIVKLILNVNNPSSSTETKYICEGASYKGYTKTGTYTQKLVNKLGCDSVYTLQLIVHAPVKKVEKKTVCYGSNYKGQTKTGTYYFNYKTSYGCDSIEQLDLEVLTRDTTVLTKTICKGEKYDGYGEAGSYIYKKKNSLGCDSVVSLTLNVRAMPKVSLTFRETLCSNTGVFQLDSLNAGIPKGGVFTGDHVEEENLFDPKGLSGAVALTYTYTDDFGCAASITKNVQLSEVNGTASCKVGAINEKVNTTLRIYPNPTNDIVTIKASAEVSLMNYTVTITDVVGKQLQTTKLQPTQTDISLRNLGAVGVYMVNVYDANGQFIKCQRVVLTD